MSKVLEKIVSGSHKVLDGMNNFYDTKSENGMWKSQNI